MTQRVSKPPTCPVHGAPSKRSTCSQCNAAYMRCYLRQRRVDEPSVTMWERARRRALRLGIQFSLSRNAINIPRRCPALGIPLVAGKARSCNSPSLDRIEPAKGYVDDNVRVLSDQANRLKSNHTLSELRHYALHARAGLRESYSKVADYVDREALLAEVRAKAAQGGPAGKEWAKVAQFLDRVFQEGFDSAGRGTPPDKDRT